MLNIRVYGRPAPKGSLRCLGRGRHIDDNPNTQTWMQLVRQATREQHPDIQPDAEHVWSVEICFWLRWPKSYGKHVGGVPVAKKPDVDKLQRAVLDALTGIVWQDDAQVYSCHGVKYYEDLSSPMGCEIRIYPRKKEHPKQ